MSQISIHYIPLDGGGYARKGYGVEKGRYFGVGERVYMVEVNDGGIRTGFRRAKDRPAVRRALALAYPRLRVGR